MGDKIIWVGFFGGGWWWRKIEDDAFLDTKNFVLIWRIFYVSERFGFGVV